MASPLLERGGNAIPEMIAASHKIVEVHAGSDKAATFAQALIAMAETIAMASGGGFLGMGNKIGKEEKVVLDVLKKLLQLES